MQQHTNKDADNDRDIFSLESLTNKLVVFDNQECVFLEKRHIIYAEASGSYTKIHLMDGNDFIISKNLKTLTEKLNDPAFIRIHKSYLINVQFIYKYIKNEGGYLILQNNKSIPVATRKKASLHKMMEQLIV